MDKVPQVPLGAIDFTTIEVWTKGGLITYSLLFVMKVATRTVHFAGCTTHPNDAWMQRIARNLTDCCDGFLQGIRYVLMDRNGAFCPAFRVILESGGVQPVRLPAKSPNLNAHLERFHLSLQSECLEKMILFGETMLRNAVREFLLHYHGEENGTIRGSRTEFSHPARRSAESLVRFSAGNDSEDC